MEICVEKPVVAPQSRWNKAALCRPSGATVFVTAVFVHASEHPPTRGKSAAVSNNLILLANFPTTVRQRQQSTHQDGAQVLSPRAVGTKKLFQRPLLFFTNLYTI